MTEADREHLMTEYANLSEELKNQITAYVTTPQEILNTEKEHLLRCIFFADMLEDME